MGTILNTTENECQNAPGPASPRHCRGATNAGTGVAPRPATINDVQPEPTPLATGRPWWPGAGQALAIWLGSRAALSGFVLLAGYLLGTPPAQQIHAPGAWILERLVWWDSFHFLRIAGDGYPPTGRCCDQAYFPGYPAAIRALTPVVGGYPEWAALLVTLLFGGVAAVLLWRLATERAAAAGNPHPERAGITVVSFLAVAPYGIFLSAAYSETMFLAFAIGAWWAGGRRRWWLAGLLLAGATATRINGMFLATALAVMYLGQLRADGRWRPRVDVLALLAPAAVIMTYFGWLHQRTGSWTAWQDAQKIGWQRETAWPWQGIAIAWRSLRSTAAPDLVISRTADLVTILAGLVLVGVLLALRRWPDAIYLGLSVAVVACSTVLISSPRYALTWFPVFLLVTDLVQQPRWQWLRPALLIGCPPVAAAVALLFSAHQWVA